MAPPSTRVQEVVRQARRRVIVVIAGEELCWALAGALAALCVLLAAGAQIFDWRWTGLIFAAALACAGWRTRRRLPDAYRVAQIADAGLNLGDLLSTAWHYQKPDARTRASEPFLAALDSAAALACRKADVRRAIPLRWTRSAWAASGAAAAAALLFTVRVGVLRSFDLRSPLVAVSFDTLTGAPKPAPDRKELAKAAWPPFGAALDDPDQAGVREKDLVAEESLRSVEGGDSEPQPGPAAAKKTRTGEGQDAGESSGDGEALNSGKEEPAADSAGAQKQGERGQQKSGPPPKDNGLLDKMRDALASLMDKFKLETPHGEGQQGASKGNPQAGQSKGEKGAPQQGRPDERGQPGEAQAGNQKAGADSTQQARSGQPGPKDQSSENENSGIGRQDGRKETALAEQQQALGKLSELLGKRSLNVQAEVMVEVSNSRNQQLKTPYVNRTGRHIEAGSNLNRDEVPLHLQEYIQRYYEQIRK